MVGCDRGGADCPKGRPRRIIPRQGSRHARLACGSRRLVRPSLAELMQRHLPLLQILWAQDPLPCSWPAMPMSASHNGALLAR